jgi:hypothetical protein
MSKSIDITGKTFGRLSVLGIAGHASDGRLVWHCQCTCGHKTIVRGQFLIRGHTQSCGCLRTERTSAANGRHRQSQTRLYKIWVGMKGRCNNPMIEKFSYYGGRGIEVCEQWHRFEVFRDWALTNGYAAHLSIDRIDRDGNYEPANCRWVSHTTQMRNTSHNRAVVRSDGRRFELIIDAARETGCTAGAIVQVCQGKNKTAYGYGWCYAI